MTAARWPPTRRHLLVRGMCEIRWWRMFQASLAARCCSGSSLHHVSHERMSSTPIEMPGSLSPMAMANVVVRHRPALRGMSALTVAVRRRSSCEGAMPNSLLEYVTEGSMPVTASILVVRALVRLRASLQIFLARNKTLFHRLVCLGIRRRAANPRSIPSEQGNQRLGISALNVWRGFGPL